MFEGRLAPCKRISAFLRQLLELRRELMTVNVVDYPITGEAENFRLNLDNRQN